MASKSPSFRGSYARESCQECGNGCRCGSMHSRVRSTEPQHPPWPATTLRSFLPPTISYSSSVWACLAAASPLRRCAVAFCFPVSVARRYLTFMWKSELAWLMQNLCRIGLAIVLKHHLSESCMHTRTWRLIDAQLFCSTTSVYVWMAQRITP